MSIITLTTDFGTKDYTVAAIKGRLFQDLEDVAIIDISHQITPFNVPEAAYILKGAYPNFPKNTVHIIGVDSEKNDLHKHLVVRLNNHFFIGADNGIFSLLSGSEPFDEIVEIHHPKSETSSFPTLDVFVDVAVEIINGTPLSNIGKSIQECKEWLLNKPNISKENELIGHIIYIDQLGNVVTDISKELFDRVVSNRNFEIIVSVAKINKIHANYSALINYSLPPSQQQKPGKAMAIFNSLNLLEIALYKGEPNKGGSAANLLGLCVGDSIKITYNN
jgi:S-adenosylmethionine hydrolase